MTINGMTGPGTQSMYGSLQTDPYSRNIQTQIANAQKRLQELSSNDELSMEDKMKKRQELMQEISDLNNQLRQHQTEQKRKQESERDNNSMEEMYGRTENTQAAGRQTGFSQISMQAILSADSAMGQAQVQGSVKSHMEGRARVLKAEIKMDAASGTDTAKKETELAEIESRASAAASSQMSTLSEIGKNLKKADKDETEANKKDKETEKDKEEKVMPYSADSGSKTADAANSKNDKTADAANSKNDKTAEAAAAYTPIDIRL